MNPIVLACILLLLLGTLALTLIYLDWLEIKPARDAEKEFFDKNWRGKL